MSQPLTISDLPTELVLDIADFLDPISRISLRISCKHFMEIFRPPTHLDLLEAETTKYAELHNLFTCKFCLRLRPRAHFGDRMIKSKRNRGREHAAGRWCIDCGISPRPGELRYCLGNAICIFGDLFVICWTCGNLKKGARKSDGNPLPVCEDCQLAKKEAEERIRNENRTAGVTEQGDVSSWRRWPQRLVSTRMLEETRRENLYSGEQRYLLDRLIERLDWNDWWSGTDLGRGVPVPENMEVPLIEEIGSFEVDE